MIKRVVAVALITSFLFSSSAPSFAVQASTNKSEKIIPLIGLTEVKMLTKIINPIFFTQIKLLKSNSFTARVQMGENFQLMVNGLSPKSIASPILINSTGNSANLTPSIVDLDGVITLPFMRIMKKGNYVLIVRQPEVSKAIMANIKVS